MRKTFSITDEKVIDKLKEVDNQSKYIERLIRKDIKFPKELDDFDAGILYATENIYKLVDSIISIVNNRLHNNNPK